MYIYKSNNARYSFQLLKVNLTNILWYKIFIEQREKEKKMFIHFLSRVEDILSSFAYLYFIHFSRHNEKLLNNVHRDISDT